MRRKWWLDVVGVGAVVIVSIVVAACGSSSAPPATDLDGTPETPIEAPAAPEQGTTTVGNGAPVEPGTVDIVDPVEPAVENGTSVAAAPVVLPTSGEAGPGVPESSRDAEIKRLFVTIDGEDIFVKNGGEVLLGDGMVVEIFVDPYPPSTLRTWVDMYLTENGEPVADASMGIEYDMLAMVHGPFWGEAAKLGGGHYLFTLDYIMFGPWDQIVTIRRGTERIRLPLVLVAFP